MWTDDASPCSLDLQDRQAGLPLGSQTTSLHVSFECLLSASQTGDPGGQGGARPAPTCNVVCLFFASWVGLQLLKHLESLLTFGIWVIGCKTWISGSIPVECRDPGSCPSPLSQQCTGTDGPQGPATCQRQWEVMEVVARSLVLRLTSVLGCPVSGGDPHWPLKSCLCRPGSDPPLLGWGVGSSCLETPALALFLIFWRFLQLSEERWEMALGCRLG